MEFNTSSTNLLKVSCDSLILPSGPQLKNSAKVIDEALDNAISKLINSGDFTGKLSQTCVLHTLNQTFKRIILIGTDGASSPHHLISVIDAANNLLLKSPSTNAVWIGEGLGTDHEWQSSIIARSIMTVSYKYIGTGKHPTPCNLVNIVYHCSKKDQTIAAQKGLLYGKSVGGGMNIARQLGNTPANICNPNFLAKEAKKIAQIQPKLTVTVLKESDMETLKMGSLLSVSAGSVEPANLIIVKYKGTKSNTKPIVLVGKAVTFDSGGISLKPGRGMDEMKFDMCGGAAVLGVMNAVSEANLPVNVIGVVPAVENMPAGNATKPGDVVTSMSGQTIEVLNTDAEGRLILCDALTYVDKFKPDTVIDIATLTGAVIGALGKITSGLLSNNDELAAQLLSSGESSGDRAWRLPLWEEYDKQLKSNFADMANIGGEAGTITAACFLSRFTKKYKWAHLDVAGTAWISGPKKGATGRPVPILMEYLKIKASTD
jgi:leucyl aminopeptidase